ncbi:MAG: motility protein A [Anaerolineaceae bacterium]|nr:motility protein A [Anaerolineaceae bacterium]
MDLATILGMVFGVAVVGIVMMLDGGSPLELFSHPAAILLIFGGSIAATTVTVSLATLKGVPTLIKQAITTNKFDVNASIELIVKMADRARRDGLLALEEESKKIDDKFLQKGIMMVVDGVDQAQVRAILETTIEQTRARHRVGIGFFGSAGGFAPTFGIIGTVMGLISVLKQLDNPATLAKSIASAFLATLWGLLAANLIYLPLSGKLKSKSEEEAHIRYMQLEGIISIQAGENPRIVREKLNAFLPPAALKGDADKAKAPAAKKAASTQKASA